MTTSKTILAPDLIPQKAPFVFVDDLFDVEEKSWKSSFKIPTDHVFVDKGTFMSAGLVEVVAQTVAAGMTLIYADEKPRVGFIGEVKSFKINDTVSPNDTLETHVEIVNEVFGVLIINGTISRNATPIATGTLKLVIQDQ